MKLTAESTVFNDEKVQNKFSELVVDADGIRTEVSKKVGNDEVISRINQSAESVKIQASKVEVDGTLIVGKDVVDSAIWVQVGKIVTVTGALTIPSGTSNTTLLVTGLPVPTIATTSNIGFVANDNNSTSTTYVSFFLTSDGAIRLKAYATSNISARFTFSYVAN